MASISGFCPAEMRSASRRTEGEVACCAARSVITRACWWWWIILCTYWKSAEFGVSVTASFRASSAVRVLAFSPGFPGATTLWPVVLRDDVSSSASHEERASTDTAAITATARAAVRGRNVCRSNSTAASVARGSVDDQQLACFRATLIKIIHYVSVANC